MKTTKTMIQSIGRSKDGNITVILRGEKRKRQLYKDEMGYYTRIYKCIDSHLLVNRFEEDDVKILNDYFGN